LKNDEERSKLDIEIPYRELVGALTYLSVTTRPDISFAVSELGQFNNCYNNSHWTAAKRVLRYLKGTKDLGLIYEPGLKPLIGFVDSDWGSCTIDRRSHTGYTFLLGGGPISWDSRKQKTVALSSTEAEYMALTDATKEAIFLSRFLASLNLKDLASVKLYSDNMGALKLAKNPVFHARSKHIDIRVHFIREILKNGDIEVNHISTDDMAADILTKKLARPKHEACVKMLGLKYLSG